MPFKINAVGAVKPDEDVMAPLAIIGIGQHFVGDGNVDMAYR